MQFTMPKLSMPAFPHIPVAFFVNVPILLIIFFLFAILYSIVSGVLIYHWSEYGMHSPGIVLGRTLFLLVSAALFGVALFSLYLY